jgi:hypothetical protein
MVVPDDLERAGAAHEAGQVLDAMLTTFCPMPVLRASRLETGDWQHGRKVHFTYSAPGLEAILVFRVEAARQPHVLAFAENGDAFGKFQFPVWDTARTGPEQKHIPLSPAEHHRVRFRLPLRFNPLGRPGGPHPSVCGASAVVLVIITARRSGSPVATAIAALGRCVQFFRITAASVVGCTRPSAPRSSSGTVLGPRMPARPLAILPAAAEIDADEDGEGDEEYAGVGLVEE